MKILISRTDSIGDVVLTLPLCEWIKRNIQGAKIIFICQKLTEPILSNSNSIDEIHVWNGKLPEGEVIIHVFPNKEVAKEAKRIGIPVRVGTSHRFFHLRYCNRLVNFTRIKSDLHEAQLNFKLLKGIGHQYQPDLSEIFDHFNWKETNSNEVESFLNKKKKNIILHMKSRGSAKEWSTKNFLSLAEHLNGESFNIVLTGTNAEKDLVLEETPEIFDLPHVSDTFGKLSLTQLIDLIRASDGLVACSTGPLHLAGALGIKCVGLFPTQKPMHAGRWGPLGKHSTYIEDTTSTNEKLLAIEPSVVLQRIKEWDFNPA